MMLLRIWSINHIKTDIKTRCNDCNTSYTLLRSTKLSLAECINTPGRLCCKPVEIMLVLTAAYAPAWVKCQIGQIVALL